MQKANEAPDAVRVGPLIVDVEGVRLMRIPKGNWYSYGTEPSPSPERNLGIAVIERTIVDAIGGPSVPAHFQRDALKQIKLGPLLQNNRFYWWIDLLYDDPMGTLRSIQKAFESGEIWRVVSAHRCGRGGWIKLGTC